MDSELSHKQQIIEQHASELLSIQDAFTEYRQSKQEELS
jgi:hypothetical protein